MQRSLNPKRKVNINKYNQLRLFDTVYLLDSKMINENKQRDGHYYVVTDVDQKGYVTLNPVTHVKKYFNKKKLDGFDGKSYLLSPYVDRDIRNNLIHQSECRIANKNLSTKDKNHIRKYIISKINKNKRKRIKKHLALARQDR